MLHSLDVFFVRDFDGRSVRISSVTHVLPGLRRSTHSYTFPCFTERTPVLRKYPGMDSHRFDSLCPQRAHHGALCLDGAIVMWSDPTSDLVSPCNSIGDAGMLRAANYSSSHSHTWCRASAPTCSFYRVTFRFTLV